MQMKKDGFLGKLYRFSEAVVREFWSNEYLDYSSKYDRRCYYHEDNTDTCQFIRMVFLWMPLVMVLAVLTYAVPLFVVLVLPIILFGGAGYGTFWGVVISLGLLFGGAAWVGNKLKGKMRFKTNFKMPGVETRTFIVEHYKGIKGKYCPTISFSKGDE